ncbi:Type 4 prepilin-like proteins leader peptide-processing enzyme [Actinoplanes sp. SE50]|uniref:prepilin peptidase n=1 Tax=unclassified Actinoplanes TaxID=2626549 RepID=UPI00023ED67C|nr:MULTISPECIES: prepilin peptidase [unclassified Actinoplanes]AEV86785.1 Type 4 prepilin-like proteins leader peptide-processing enzyme [Actinoplanes sp. SE50/110]ATO85182.1 Type 4 prepilin-like proteins leader peptide-processing enzyme [Actinoplanes sp. SE50]SLM02592.1 Type 4 prepilin-like proteins leader peptide-processing enzyme [Actinoplanes sp. SE50/110]
MGPAAWWLEAGTLVAAGLVLFGARSDLERTAYLWFAVLGVVLACVDIAVRRLPNLLTAFWGAGLLAGLLIPALAQHRFTSWLQALALGIVLTVLFGLVALVRPGQLGWGDVRAIGVAGIALGWLGWAAAYAGIFLSFTFALIFVILRGRAHRKQAVRFGPFLVAGAVVVCALMPTVQ